MLATCMICLLSTIFIILMTTFYKHSIQNLVSVLALLSSSTSTLLMHLNISPLHLSPQAELLLSQSWFDPRLIHNDKPGSGGGDR